MKLPTFIIVGAARSGTTSLSEYLKQHPQVFIAPIKEPNYFSSDIVISNFESHYRSRALIDLEAYFREPVLKEIHSAHISKWEHYLSLYRNVRDQIAIGEASVSYLYSTSAAKNIKERIPEAKIIMILRNPVDRAYSHYMMDLRDGRTWMPFRKALKKDMASKKKGWGISHLYMELGLYYEQVKRYYDLYDRKQIKIYLFEDLKEPATLIKDLFSFLGVDENFNVDTSQRHNESKIPLSASINYILKDTSIRKVARSLSLSAQEAFKSLLVRNGRPATILKNDRSYLQSLYCDDIVKLSGLIKRDLSQWLENT